MIRLPVAPYRLSPRSPPVLARSCPPTT